MGRWLAYLDMQKGCFSMRSHAPPSAFTRRYMRYGSSISSLGLAACTEKDRLASAAMLVQSPEHRV